MLSLRPYQEQCADFIFERDRSLVLAPVGSGKTCIALTALRDLFAAKIIKRALVLAPKRVCTDVWPQEARLWAPGLHLAVAVGDPKARRFAFESGAQVVVTNFDNIQSLPDLTSFDCLVIDELTKMKSPSGLRFKALEKAAKHITMRIGLTGSFTSNGLEDVYGQSKIIDVSLLGRSKGAFLQQHFMLINKEYGEWAPRPGALKEVMAKIKPATYLLEGKSSERELHTVLVPFDLGDRAPYEQMKKDSVYEDITALTAAAAIQKLQQGASGFFYDTARTAVWFDTAKFDAFDDLMSENQWANTLVFYQFKEELAELRRRYPKARTIDEPGVIADWNAGKVPMLLGHPASAGHGINLQHGSHHLVWFSLPWSVELMEQGIGRLHRSGQQHDVWCYVMQANHTVEQQVLAALTAKRKVSDEAIRILKSC
jgi:SNF2 family DNA or RNA helicase